MDSVDALIDYALGLPTGPVADYSTPDGIIAFVRDVLGATPTPYQEDILRHLVLRGRVAVRGPHGLGKTALSSWVVLWAVTCCGDDVKVVTTASAWRQLIRFTWPEIHKWAAKADWSKVGMALRAGVSLMKQNIELPGRAAFATASSTPAFIEGAHARTVVYVFDEAKAIPAPIWDAADGAFSTAGSDTGGRAYALAISTPGDTSGRFYDIHKRRKGLDDWWVRHVTVNEAIAAGQVSADWVAQKRAQWGETSPVFLNRVLGEFAEAGTDVLIPLAWVEAAIARWHELSAAVADAPPDTLGVDVARYGDDKTVIAARVGRVVQPLRVYAHQGTMETAGRVLHTVGSARRTPIAVDVDGVGAGVVDRLREQGYNVTGVHFGGSAKDRNGNPVTDGSGELTFADMRSAMWWALRDALDPANPQPLALPDDDILTGDLTAPHWGITSSGRIRVESKEDYRKRLGRSPDAGDAVALTTYFDLVGSSAPTVVYDESVRVRIGW